MSKIEFPKLSATAVPVITPASEQSVPPPVAAVVVAPEAKLTLAEPHPMSRPRAFYVASQWHILEGAAPDTIVATNNTTADKYEGPIADFNAMLKGN